MDDKRFNRLEDKLDHISEKIGSIDVTLAAQHVSLQEHTRRSEANEKALEILKEEIKPVLSHVTIVNMLGKLALALLTSEIIWKVISKLLAP